MTRSKALLVCCISVGLGCSQTDGGETTPAGQTASNANDVTTLPVTGRSQAGSAAPSSTAATAARSTVSTTSTMSAMSMMTASAGRGATAPPNRAMPAAGASPNVGTGGAGTPPSAGSGATETTARELPPLDCGPDGLVIENAGPPKNRVNYAIIGDGYTKDQLPTLKQHIDVAMKKRFSPVIGQPYGRYRKFVNICVVQLVSENGPIGSGATALNCSGDDQSRLARCDTNKVNMELKARLPASFEIDWKAVVLNNDRWWNTGAVVMLWSGGHKDAAGAALHEGGHGFHQLADEYDGTDTNCSREFEEVNSTTDSMMTAGKWDMWLGYNQADATGMQTTIVGSRYCKSGQYRPSDNSMMNMLFGDKPDTAYNSVSREKMAMDVWRAVTPIDETKPPAGDAGSATMLEVVVIDPEVVSVDWSVDGQMVAAKGGPKFDIAAHKLAPGSHTISAKAYDNAGPELVRYLTGTKYGRMNWARSQQTVEWKVSVQ